MQINSTQTAMPKVNFKGYITNDALKYAINKSNMWFDMGDSIISPNERSEKIINGVKEKLAKDTVIDIGYDINYNGEIAPHMIAYNKSLNEGTILDFDFNITNLYPGEIQKVDETLVQQFVKRQRDELIKTGNVEEVWNNLSKAAKNFGKQTDEITKLGKYIMKYREAMSQLPKFKKENFYLDFEEKYDLRVRSYKKWIKSGAVLDKKA